MKFKQMKKVDWKKRYETAKKDFLKDKNICKENRGLYTKFFEYEEYKLKRVNGLRELDDGAYNTLYGYIQKFKNVNKWFENKPLKELTKEDIKEVYDGLEDGKIKNQAGKPFENPDDTYYSKVFKSKLFELAGKADLAREVIEYNNHKQKEVRFITEEDFRKIVNSTYKQHHRVLLWLAWDIGENINALLKLKKKDFHKQNNPYTKEPEYRVNLKKEILKRTRKPRSEITNYNESVELLDQHLRNLKDNDSLFNFGYANAKKIINRAVARTKVKCIPNGEVVTWKDLRSGMACDLLKKGYTTDEVNARLGHKPSSDEIDKYVNFLAIDRHTPKKKVQQFEMEKLNEELQEIRRREKIQTQRNENLKLEMQAMREQQKNISGQVVEILGLVSAGKIKKEDLEKALKSG